MKFIRWFIFLILFSPSLIWAESSENQNGNTKGFAPIVIKVMNRGTNALMGVTFIFTLIYSIYIALAISFGSRNKTDFIALFWGAGIALSGGALAKIYYLFLS